MTLEKGFALYPYGLAVSAAALLSLLLAREQMKRRGLAPEIAERFAVRCIPLSLLLARLVYCLLCQDGFARSGAMYLVDFRSGGYTLIGALLGGGLALYWTAHAAKVGYAKLADALAAPTALLVGLCRLAEGLVGQGYGWYIEDWFDPMGEMSLFHPENYDFVLRFPFAVQDMYGEWCWAIFVVEALLAFAIFAWAMTAKKKQAGVTAQMTLLMLASATVLCESLRQDAVLRFGFVRVGQIAGAVCMLCLLIYGCRSMKDRSMQRILSAAIGFAAMVGVVIAMEFAVEKRIVFLEAMTTDLCNLVTALACAGLVAVIGRVLCAPRRNAEKRRSMKHANHEE